MEIRISLTDEEVKEAVVIYASQKANVTGLRAIDVYACTGSVTFTDEPIKEKKWVKVYY